jgi:hypothetical protein
MRGCAFYLERHHPVLAASESHVGNGNDQNPNKHRLLDITLSQHIQSLPLSHIHERRSPFCNISRLVRASLLPRSRSLHLQRYCLILPFVISQPTCSTQHCTLVAPPWSLRRTRYVHDILAVASACDTGYQLLGLVGAVLSRRPSPLVIIQSRPSRHLAALPVCSNAQYTHRAHSFRYPDLNHIVFRRHRQSRIPTRISRKAVTTCGISRILTQRAHRVFSRTTR